MSFFTMAVSLVNNDADIDVTLMIETFVSPESRGADFMSRRQLIEDVRSRRHTIPQRSRD